MIQEIKESRTNSQIASKKCRAEKNRIDHELTTAKLIFLFSCFVSATLYFLKTDFYVSLICPSLAFVLFLTEQYLAKK